MRNSNIFDRGRIENAKYFKTGVPDYDGNPLIEALPPILSAEQAARRMSRFPKFEEYMREAPNHIRYHHIRSCLKFFSPLDIHLDLERRLSCAIRMGYSERNPLKAAHWQKVQDAIDFFDEDSFDQYGDSDEYNSTAALGFNVAGASGGGKSQSFRRGLNIYPQVIYHKEFQGENFTESQLVWLKLDCPFDGSIKGLCINLFQAIDAILNTNHQENYISGKKGTDEMIPALAKVAANHHLGILVIDEIQRISLAKSGGIEKMLNFFVQLVNTIGVPVCLVGTFKALPIFTGNFSQTRRGMGIIWDRMSFDDEWDRFFKSMWKYELTRSKTPAGKLDRLSKVLYEETQGIIDLAIKAFTYAQELAIDDKGNESERITPGVIRSVVRDKFKMLLPALEAFKKKDKKAMALFEDAYSKFVSEYLKENVYQRQPDKEDAPSSVQVFGEITKEPEIKILLDKSLENAHKFFKIDSTPNSFELTTPETVLAEEQLTQQPRGLKKTAKDPNGILPEILKNAQNGSEVDSYEALKKAGFIHSDDDFISSESTGKNQLEGEIK